MNKQEFLSALITTKPGININGIDESMGYFYFTGKNVITFNNTISIQSPLKTNFRTFLRGNDLVNLLMGTKSETMDIQMQDTKVKIKAKNIQATLNTIEDEDFVVKIKAIAKAIKSVEWKPLPKNFVQAISACSTVFVAGELDSILSCASITKDTCLASDNQRIVKSKFDSTLDDMLIKCTEIGKLTGIDPIEYGISDNWVHFKNESNCIFSLIKVEGDFPEISSLFDFDGEKLILPKNLTDGINITEIFVDSISPYINIKFEKGNCILAISSKYGSVKHRSKIKYSGKPIEFAINPEFLKSMIQHSTTVVLNEEKTKLKLETKNYSIVSALYKNE